MFDLHRFRKAKFKNQKEFISFINLSQGYVSEIERGIKSLPQEAYDKLYEKYGEELKNYEKEELPLGLLQAKIQELEGIIKLERDKYNLLEGYLKEKDKRIEEKDERIKELLNQKRDTNSNCDKQTKKA